MKIKGKIVKISENIHFAVKGYISENEYFIVMENNEWCIHTCQHIINESSVMSFTKDIEKNCQIIYKVFQLDDCFRVRISSDTKICTKLRPPYIYNDQVFLLKKESTDYILNIKTRLFDTVFIEFKEYCIHNSKNNFFDGQVDLTSCGNRDTWYSDGICTFCGRPIIQDTFVGGRHSIYLEPMYDDKNIIAFTEFTITL